ncbi:uncharacterized protein BJ212DRAFT_1305141 [Suillus subaureus]|uniref:Uncharacterized protein n=1 Tax=Suillus subaureus TaxID=48587 RepID=A0A9P7J3P6_9AGAM|nr:uncharacterized protein BJ212DRAFT_1305141 [Suillus subaureus]KAG1801157.1 hypothetical protein BJ212DRAFT_1305141 [Suillus subaureus]
MIQLFGAPNGLCLSITESKHIKAVKEPWCRSSRYKALSQMLLTNQCLNKIAAAQSDFEAHGMLQGLCLSNALQALGESNGKLLDNSTDEDEDNNDALQARPDCLCLNEPQNQTVKGDLVGIVDGPTVQAHVELAAAPVPGCSPNVPALMLDLNLPILPTLIQQFLHDQLHIDDDEPPKFDPAMAPTYMGRVSVFSSAAASFYAPSDLSGTGGMRCEHIQAMPSCMNDEVSCGLDGLAIARVLHFLGFKYQMKYLRCAVIRWFSYVTDSQDPDTGMYLVAPSTNDDGMPDVSIIHIDCIFHAAHLIPLYGSNVLPRTITLHDSYNIFRTFYVNKYADHHAFEVA